MDNAVFEKTMENGKIYTNFELAPTVRRRNYLVSEPNCHTKKFFTKGY